MEIIGLRAHKGHRKLCFSRRHGRPDVLREVNNSSLNDGFQLDLSKGEDFHGKDGGALRRKAMAEMRMEMERNAINRGREEEEEL